MKTAQKIHGERSSVVSKQSVHVTPTHEVIAVYHTKRGQIAYEITRSVLRDGLIAYSYTGKYGAGSGHCLGTMRRFVALDMKTRRGMHLHSGTCILQKIDCPTCEGTGIDNAHHWPDGSPAACETCEGTGERP